MTRTEMSIATVYTTRLMLADLMESVAKLMREADTLDTKYDNNVMAMYTGIVEAFKIQIDLEKNFKK